MIDIELQLYNIVAPVLYEKYPDITIYSEYVNTSTKFPCVSIVQADSKTDSNSLPLSNIPQAVSVLIEINIYSNSTSNGKQECKDILAVIDELMVLDGYKLTYNEPIQNLNDATIYRRIARYTKTQPTTGGIYYG